MTENHLHATVSLRGIVFVEGAVVLVRRATDGGWELPGGRLGATEDVRDGVRREIREETGLAPAVVEPVHTLSWRNDADEGRFAVYFHCTAERRSVSLSEEHTDHAWVSPAEAADRLSTPQGRAVERAAATRRKGRPDGLDPGAESERASPARNER